MSKESFEDLLNQSFAETDVDLQAGDQMTAKVIELLPEYVFIHFGGKKEGVILAEEFAGEDGTADVKVGDELQVFYVGRIDNEETFTARVGKSAVNEAILRYMYQNGLPVYGRVTDEVKGGFTIAVGNQNAFCPFSQIGLAREEEGAHLGKTYNFTIIEFNPKGRKFTVSRRQILQAEQNKTIEKLADEMREGDKVRVTVKLLKSFGAIVDLNGIDALIPISELSHHKIRDASEAVSVGDQVEAEILKLDWQNRKISLSRKKVMHDPWYDQVNFNEGALIEGTVSSIKKFGVFVKLNDFVEGLVPGIETGYARDTRLETKFTPGDKVTVLVMRIDRDQKRIGLSIKKAKENADRQELDKYLDNQEGGGGGGQSLGDLFKKSMQ